MNAREYQQLLDQHATDNPSTPDLTLQQTSRKADFRVKNGILYKTTPNGDRRVLKRGEVEAVLQSLHDHPSSAHFKVGATTKKAKQRFWWPNMAKDIKHYVDTCDTCQRRDPPNTHKTQPLKSIEVTGPFERWGIDIVHLPETTDGNKYAVVAQDYFTKWPEARALSETSAETIAKFITEDIISRHGCPQKIQSDNGPQFAGNVVRELCERYDIKRVLISPYHPQSNGMVERLNGTIGTALSKLAEEHKDSWDEYLALTLFAYRTTPQSSTNTTPFYLVYGREARLPIDLVYASDEISSPETVYKRIVQMLDQLQPARDRAAQNIQRAQDRQKKSYDQRVRPVTFDIGDKVLRYNSKDKDRHDVKLKPKWTGPYWVHDTFHNGTYKLRTMDGDVLVKPAHGDRLKLYKSRHPEPVVVVEQPLPSHPFPTTPDQLPKGLPPERLLRRSPRHHGRPTAS